MGRTPSTTHRWHFCRALYLQPSPEKLGRAALRVCVCFACSKRQLRCGDSGDSGDSGDFGCHFLKQVDYFSLVDEIKEDSC